MGKTAIILGSTGITGTILLNKLLVDSYFDKIKVFNRSKQNNNHPKIEEYVVDLQNLELVKNHFTADVVFCCIGTTKAKTPDETAYKQIDYGIPVTAAKISKENNIGTFIVISALGADPKSQIFYNKTKGEMERDVMKQKIKNTYILQPSLIDFSRSERLGERIGVIAMKLLNPFFISKLKKYRSIKPEVIATAMINLSKISYPLNKIESDKITEIAKM